MKSIGAGLVASALVVLATGCASSTPEAKTGDQGHVVIGSGSAQDRQDIRASDDQMVQIEQSGIPTAQPSVIAPAQVAPAPPTSTASSNPTAPTDTTAAAAQPPPDIP